MNKKNIFTLLLLIHHSINSCDYRARATFSIGPAWHNFFSYEGFNLTSTAQQNGVPINQIIKTEFTPFAYFQGKLQADVNNFFNLQCTAGGGSFRQTSGAIEAAISLTPAFFGFPIELPFFYNGQIAMVDSSIGISSGFNRCINPNIYPSMGYVFNHQRLLFNVVNADYTQLLINKWQGPYVGVEGSLSHNAITVSLLSKIVIGSINSRLSIASNPDTNPFISQNPFSTWHAPMIGFIFDIAAEYAVAPYWSIGSSFALWYYKNNQSGSVTNGAFVAGITNSAFIQQIIWQQYMWSFFINYQF